MFELSTSILYFIHQLCTAWITIFQLGLPLGIGICIMAFNLNDFNLNPFAVDSLDRVNHASLGMKLMHECNAHNFPLDLAGVEVPSTNG